MEVVEQNGGAGSDPVEKPVTGVGGKPATEPADPVEVKDTPKTEPKKAKSPAKKKTPAKAAKPAADPKAEKADAPAKPPEPAKAADPEKAVEPYSPSEEAVSILRNNREIARNIKSMNLLREDLESKSKRLAQGETRFLELIETDLLPAYRRGNREKGFLLQVPEVASIQVDYSIKDDRLTGSFEYDLN